MSDPNDELLRAYATLVAFQANLPSVPMYEFDERYVADFHDLLDRLGALLGRDLSEFRIPASDLYRPIASSNSLTGKVQYRGERHYIWRDRFLAKFEAAMNYINLLMPEAPVRRMGF